MDTMKMTRFGKKFCIVLAAALCALTLGYMVMAETSQSKGQWCERQWLTESANFVDRDAPDYMGLLESWKKYREKCQGTVAYEARMALIYYFLDKPTRARDVLRSVENVGSEYDYLRDILAILTEYKEYMLAQKIDESLLRAFKKRFSNYVGKYPESMEGYAQLGAVQMSLGEHESAIISFAAAIEKAPETADLAGLLRNLTVSYSEIGHYQDAYDVAGAAINRRKSVTEDAEFMLALAKAEAGLGMFKEAETTLRVIVTKHPSLREEPDFQATVNFVLEKRKSEIGSE
ncbi:MAG: hypothetical protein HYV16_11470 [Gammaproteobacteria bacterium]|nr:hypothetical protein [Gammaproteobacteria bacterium]